MAKRIVVTTDDLAHSDPAHVFEANAISYDSDGFLEIRNSGDLVAFFAPGKWQSAHFGEVSGEVLEDEPEKAVRELAMINNILRTHGFEGPLGAHGVADLAMGYQHRQIELHRLDPDCWAAWKDAG